MLYCEKVIIIENKKCVYLLKLRIIETHRTMKTLNYNIIGTSRAWWVMLVVGILSIIAGLAYWLMPVTGYFVAAQLFGWMLIAVGVVQLCVASGSNRGAGWGWWLAAGVIDIFVGFVLVRSMALSEMLLPWFLAAVFIYQGIHALVRACTTMRAGMRVLEIINGILLGIIGILFLEAGFVTNMMMVSTLASIAFIYWGVLLAMTSLEWRPKAE